MSFPCDMVVYVQPARDGISGVVKVPTGVIQMISHDACSIELLDHRKDVRATIDVKPKDHFLIADDIVFLRVVAPTDRHFDLVRK